MKDFDNWNVTKKHINSVPVSKYVRPREIWWCSLGLNVGAEIDGKNDTFERPVIIVKVYNKETMAILPLTSKPKSDTFHYPVETEKKLVWAKLTQVRVISSKRLLRKIGLLQADSFDGLRKAWLASL
ncbi:MAG: type II toxin-antitoxin system PemK/MazF family toxin [Patescibacteria group bacterium]